MYTQEIKALFGKEKLSVPHFEKAISHLPQEEQKRWREKVFICALCRYEEKNKTFRQFIHTFITAYRQLFDDYLICETILNERYFRLQYPDIVLKMIVCMEECTEVKFSRRQLASSLRIAFRYDCTIDTLCNRMLSDRARTEDLWEWYEQVKIS